jgi:hypothetical protein
MICAPALLPALFVETPIPAGPISDEAARLIAALLWAAAEEDLRQESNPTKTPVTLAGAPGGKDRYKCSVPQHHRGGKQAPPPNSVASRLRALGF